MKLQFAKQLRAQRARLAITQRQLAEVLGVSFEAVSKWERGASLPLAITQEGALTRLQALPAKSEP